MSLASIVLTGLAVNDPVPGVYVENLFAQGPAGGDNTDRPILLIGNKTSAGSATVDSVIYGPDSPVPLQTEADCISLFGTGSELHRMWRRAAKINKETAIYAIAVTASAGASASATIVVATTATGNGVHRAYVGDEFVETAIATGDTVTTIGDGIAGNINAMTHWAVTAANVAGTVTVTARVPGPRGNWIRLLATITAGIGTTTTATTEAFLTGGTTADSNTTALTNLLARKFYYIASAANDSTQLGALVTQVNLQALPTTGIRQRVFAGSVDTPSNANTTATTRNTARAEVISSEGNPWTPAEIAANAAAVYALEELPVVPRCNFSGYGNDAATASTWLMPAPRSTADWPTRAEIKSALNNGVTPIGVNPNGSTYIVKRITTRSLNGSTADYRIRDAHKVTVCDFFADALVQKTVLQFSGKKLKANPLKGARPPGPDTVWPDLYRGLIFSLIDLFDARDLLQNIPQIKAATLVQKEVSPPSRVSALIPLQPIDIADQFANLITQVA